MSSNIGVGIVTCNRPEFFEQCFKSIPSHIGGIDHIVIVNDGWTSSCRPSHCDWNFFRFCNYWFSSLPNDAR